MTWFAKQSIMQYFNWIRYLFDPHISCHDLVFQVLKRKEIKLWFKSFISLHTAHTIRFNYERIMYHYERPNSKRYKEYKMHDARHKIQDWKQNKIEVENKEYKEKIREKIYSKGNYTTSMSWESLRPNLTVSRSELLPTGRIKRL